ncbi:MAG: sigma-54-dependent Fis family transcriptional regulator [Dongiaceae bacterium]
MSTEHVDRLLATIARPAPLAATPLEAEIRSSWRRCVEEYGLEPDRVDRVQVLTTGELKDHRAPVEEVLAIAQPEIDGLFRRLVDSDYIVIFTDAHGVAVDFRVAPAIETDARRFGLYLGSIWNERAQGTNGVGTSLSIGRPVSVVQSEHFALQNTSLTCTAVPVYDPHGRICAVFDIGTPRASDHTRERLLLEIMRNSARRMESRFFRRVFRDALLVRLSADPDFMDAADESLLALDAGGRIVGADRRAPALLGLGQAERLVGRRAEAVLRLGEAALLATVNGPPADLGGLARHGGRLYARVLPRPERRIAPAGARLRPPPAPRPDAAARAAGEALDLARLAGGDARMAQSVHVARRLADSGLPILLIGETGTGKGAFAEALHRASARAAGPFVPVNCAAIPEALIEGELFGYRPGAFTGAAREGARGKILEACGGTLFLDEIGDMPVAAQTRLLRVLSEGEVTPLGAPRPVAVDLSVIAATHQPVEALVAQGRFREDLYHRLAGAVLRLPALRERSDRIELIERVVAAEAATRGRSVVLAPETALFLRRYPWPGNIRELRHVARYAVALCEDDRVGLDCLPERLVGDAPDRPADADGVRARVVRLTLSRCNWNVSQAARMLGVSRATLYRHIRLHAIQRP